MGSEELNPGETADIISTPQESVAATAPEQAESKPLAQEEQSEEQRAPSAPPMASETYAEKKTHLDAEFLEMTAEIEAKTGQPLSEESRQNIYADTAGRELEKTVPIAEKAVGFEFAKRQIGELSDSLRRLSGALRRSEIIDQDSARFGLLLPELESMAGPGKVPEDVLREVVLRLAREIDGFTNRRGRIPERDDIEEFARIHACLRDFNEVAGSLGRRIWSERGEDAQATVKALGRLQDGIEEKRQKVSRQLRGMEEFR